MLCEKVSEGIVQKLHKRGLVSSASPALSLKNY